MQAIEDLAHANKFRVCPEFVGHGVGRFFHSAPLILPVHSDMPDTMQVGCFAHRALPLVWLLRRLLVETTGTRLLLCGDNAACTAPDWLAVACQAHQLLAAGGADVHCGADSGGAERSLQDVEGQLDHRRQGRRPCCTVGAHTPRHTHRA